MKRTVSQQMLKIPEDVSSDFRSLFSFYESQSVLDMDKIAMRQVRLRLPFVPGPFLSRLTTTAANVLQGDPSLLHIQGDYVVVGGLNGSILDLLRILKSYGSPQRQKYLFLGGLGNGAEFGVQVIVLVMLMKILWPTNVYILRGCHEFSETCAIGGLRTEIDLLYGPHSTVFDDIIQVFRFLPFAAVLNYRVFCCFGGIGRNMVDVESIATIRRPLDNFGLGLVAELCWSVPTAVLPMFLPGTRNYGNFFGREAVGHFLKQNHLQLLVRTYNPNGDSCGYSLDDQVMTVVSSGTVGSQVGVFLVGQVTSQTVLWPGIAPLKRADVTFVTSVSETRFAVPLPLSVLPMEGRLSQLTIPACAGLRVAGTKHGMACPATAKQPRRSVGGIIKKPVIRAKVSKLSLGFGEPTWAVAARAGAL
jgi:protein phosphatase